MMRNPKPSWMSIPELNRQPLHDGVIEYQQFYVEPMPLAPTAEEPVFDRYEATLMSLQDTDPESYRMVIYSWA